MKDCNVKMIKEVGKLATAFALEDYKNGDLAKDVFEQLGRVLHWMQKESNKKPKGKQK